MKKHNSFRERRVTLQIHARIRRPFITAKNSTKWSPVKTHSSFSPESLQWAPGWILNEPELPLNQQQRAVWPHNGRLPEIRAWGMGPVMGVHVLSLWAPVAISIVISCCSPPLHYTRTSVSLQSCSHLSRSLSHIHTHSPFQIPLCYCKLLGTPFLQTLQVLALKYIFACPFCFSIIQLQKVRAETCHHGLRRIINFVIHLQYFVSKI